MKSILKLFLAFVLLLSGSFAQSAVNSTDILIDALVEKQVITQDEAAALRNEIAAKEKETATPKTSAVTGKTPLRISGYGQVRYTYSEDPAQNLNFEIKRLRVSLAGDITPIIDSKFQLEFAGSKKAVTSVGPPAKTEIIGKPVLVDAVVGIKLKQNNKLNVGQFYVPFGLENITSDAVLDTINRSQTTEKLVPGRDTGNQGRDIGIQIGGLRKLDKNKTRSFEYSIALLNGAGINTGDDNRHMDVAAHVVARPGIDGLAIGGSYYDGATGTAEVSHRRTGLEFSYLNGPWAVKSEYLNGKDDVSKHGYYVTLVRNLSKTTQAVIRYDRVNANAFKTTDTVKPTKVVTLGLNWFLSKDTLTRLALNYDFKREEGVQVHNDQLLVQFQTGF